MKDFILKGLAVLAFAFFLGCSSDDSVVQNPDITNIQLQISFTVVDMQVSDLSGKTNKGGTLSNKQEWEHIFEEGLAIEFTNTKTKRVYTLPYDPSIGSSDEYSISLPFGSYSYKLESLEPNSHFSEYHNYLPFAAVGNLEVANTEVVLNLIAQTDYGLVTVDSYNIVEAVLRVPKYNDVIGMPYTTSKEYYYKYVKSGEAPKVYITAFQQSLNYQLPTIRALKRYNLLLGQNKLNNINFILADFEQEDYYFVGDDEQNAKTFVPDDRFESLLIGMGYDDVMDNYVLTRNIAALKELEFGNYVVGDLTGIQDFVALETLHIHMRNLVSSSSIDLTKNTALRNLRFDYGSEPQFGPKSLDLTNNTALETIGISCSSLSYLDISKNTALKTLTISESQLSYLDISKNTVLETLEISSSHLSYLDISKNTALETLGIFNSHLSYLDISKNTALMKLHVYGYGLELNSLDLTKNTKLRYLNMNSNSLESLDLTKNTALETLGISSSHLSYLDVSKNTALETLAIYAMSLSYLDVSKNTALETIWINDSSLSYLDISKNTALVELNTKWNNQLTCIQVNEVQLYETIPSNSPTGTHEGNWLKPQNAVFALSCPQ